MHCVTCHEAAEVDKSINNKNVYIDDTDKFKSDCRKSNPYNFEMNSKNAVCMCEQVVNAYKKSETYTHIDIY